MKNLHSFFHSIFIYEVGQTPKLDDFQLNSKLTDIQMKL